MRSLFWSFQTCSVLAIAIIGGGCSSDITDPPKPPQTDPVEENYTEEEIAECREKTVSFDFPFVYNTSELHMRLAGDIGMVPTSMFPYGAHVPPYTGHIEGNGKSDWVAWLATSVEEMTLLDGDNDKKCDDIGSTCGMPLQTLLDKNPPYVAFTDGFRVKEVILESVDVGASEASGGKMWRVTGNACHILFSFMHVGYLSPLLRQRMIDAGYKDPSTATAADLWVNLVDREKPIAFAKGQIIGYPEIMAVAVDGHPGYFKAGNIEDFKYPNSHIEYNMRDLTRPSGHSYPMFMYIEDAALKSKVDFYLADPFPDFRFDSLSVQDWLWKAEAVPYTKEEWSHEDYDGIQSALGGWFETNPSGSCAFGTDAKCNDQFTIFPIHPSSLHYDPTLYEPGAAHLAYRRTYDVNEPEFSFKNGVYGEVLSPAVPNAFEGTLSIKWRPAAGDPIYQKLSYRVSESQSLMRMRYSESTEDADEVIANPAIPHENAPCDGNQVRCFNHNWPNFGG